MTGTQKLNRSSSLSQRDRAHSSVESVMLVVGNPVNFVDFDLTEITAFHREDLFEEFLFRVHVVAIVLAAQNLERLKNVVNVCRQNSCAPSD